LKSGRKNPKLVLPEEKGKERVWPMKEDFRVLIIRVMNENETEYRWVTGEGR
jgi:hypothetical protein